MSGRTERVGIVGGGMLGMTLALRLRQQGHEVTVIEGAHSLGGLASAQEIGGFTWDRFYHVILQSDLNLRSLLADLGVEHQLRWKVTRTGFYTDGKLYSLSNAVEFLRFPPLSLVSKARLAITILHASRVRDWRALENIPVGVWLQRWSGKHTWERIWLPLLKSKLGQNYRLASAAFIWAIIARMYAARRAGLKREMFGYVEGGYDVVLRRLRDHLQQVGVEVLGGRAAAQVNDTGYGAEIRFQDGGRRGFTRVVITTPSATTAALCPQLTSAERQRLHQVIYQGVTCASLLLRKPLAGFYVTNITEDWVPFTAVIEMTALVDRDRFGGHTLVYLPRYLAADDPFWQRSDEEIQEEFVAALERMYPAFRREDVVVFKVARARQVMALSTLNYSSEVLPPVSTSLPNVCVVNSAQIANGTLNVNETVGLADAKARELHSLWGAATPRVENPSFTADARAG